MVIIYNRDIIYIRDAREYEVIYDYLFEMLTDVLLVYA